MRVSEEFPGKTSDSSAIAKSQEVIVMGTSD